MKFPNWKNICKLPNVHLGIDPEFSLKNGETPGKKIGTFNPDDVNAAVDYLASLVQNIIFLLRSWLFTALPREWLQAMRE